MPRVLRGVGWFVLLTMSIAACASSASTTLAGTDSGSPPGLADARVAAGEAAVDDPVVDDPADAEPVVADLVAAEPTEVHFPERLDFTVDASTATSVDISAADGGQVSVTAADGTAYTLDIPPEALGQDTTITAAALSDVSGIPEAETMSGVQFGPDGLRFIGFATLTIVPPGIESPDVALTFIADGDGSRPHPAFPVPESADAQILVSRFSLLGRMTFRDRVGELLPVLGFDDVQLGIESELAALVGLRGRYRALGSDAAEIDLRIQENLSRYLEVVVTSTVEAPSSDCQSTRDAADAASKLVLLEDEYQPNGGVSHRTAAEAAFSTAESTCEVEAIARCKQENDPSILVDYWTEMRGWRNRLGFASKPGDDPSQYLTNARQICARAANDYVYIASGGGPEIVITGTVADLTAEFTLDGVFTGGSAKFTFAPVDAAGGSYSYTLAPFAGGGAGTYTIEGTLGEVLTLRTQASGCVYIGTCADTADVVTLTPQAN